jgi:hypothetical protein
MTCNIFKVRSKNGNLRLRYWGGVLREKGSFNGRKLPRMFAENPVTLRCITRLVPQAAEVEVDTVSCSSLMSACLRAGETHLAIKVSLLTHLGGHCELQLAHERLPAGRRDASCHQGERLLTLNEISLPTHQGGTVFVKSVYY